MLAAIWNHAYIVALLIDAGANVQVQDTVSGKPVTLPIRKVCDDAILSLLLVSNGRVEGRRSCGPRNGTMERWCSCCWRLGPTRTSAVM
jgi:hypothetical protein